LEWEQGDWGANRRRLNPLQQAHRHPVFHAHGLQGTRNRIAVHGQAEHEEANEGLDRARVLQPAAQQRHITGANGQVGRGAEHVGNPVVRVPDPLQHLTRSAQTVWVGSRQWLMIMAQGHIVILRWHG
jgi:hypothetical protein